MAIARRLQQLETRGNYERTASRRDISKLSGIQQLVRDLGHPEQSYRIIHIAGTNGKGLTGKLLSHALHQAGHRVGWYNSPHVYDIRERIQVNDRWIPESSFELALEAVFRWVDQYDDSVYLSYFDILTAIAFCAFQEQHCEWVILETGLGGKADSTNITDKALAILTPIGYDHLNVLGNTLEAIALEKLGIVRPQVPTVVAPQPSKLMPLIRDHLQQNESPFVDVTEADCSETLKLPPELSLSHQTCLQTAMAAYHTLFPMTQEEQAQWIQQASQVQLLGRCEQRQEVVWSQQDVTFPLMVWDGGHNAEALQHLVDQLQRWQVQDYTLILGLASDKLVPPLKEALGALVQQARYIILTQAQSSRAATPQQLWHFLSNTIQLNSKLTPHQECSSIQEALKLAAETLPQPVVVSGSFYILGEMMTLLEHKD